MLDIFGRDPDGDLLAQPAEWDERAADAPPVVDPQVARRRRPGARRRRPRARQRSSRATKPTGPAYTGARHEVFDKRARRVLGVFRVVTDGTFRIVPVERRQQELIVAPEIRGGAQDGDLVEVEPVAPAATACRAAGR